MAADLEREAEALRNVALGFPETYEEQPWGDRVVKVRGKIFLFCGVHQGKFGMSVKLPSSGRGVLKAGLGEPTGYGLGKAGWVTVWFKPGAKLPRERIHGWIEESYRAVAPARLVKLLDGGGANAPAAPKSAAKKSATKKTAAPDVPEVKDRRVMLLSHDPLRRKRAQNALRARVTLDATDDPAAVRARARSLDAAVIDLGRNPPDGIALAAELDASDHPILLFVTGVRDARQRREVRARAESADLFAEPPGDATVVDAVLRTLARYPRRA
jgi:predicted DNA-binding protein (MmcQ/YjbR family)